MELDEQSGNTRKNNRLEYNNIHKWLINSFGKAHKCENEDCKKVSIAFDYALIKGKNYEKKRENFIMLCRGCHTKYDEKPDTTHKKTYFHVGMKRTPESRKKMSDIAKATGRVPPSRKGKTKHGIR